MGSRVRGPIVFGWSLLLQPKLSHKKINNIYQTHNIYLPYPPKKILRGYLLSCHIRFPKKIPSIPSSTEESPVNSTINPPIKNNLNLSPYLSQFGLLKIFRSTRLYLITTEKKNPERSKLLEPKKQSGHQKIKLVT